MIPTKRGSSPHQFLSRSISVCSLLLLSFFVTVLRWVGSGNPAGTEEEEHGRQQARRGFGSTAPHVRVGPESKEAQPIVSVKAASHTLCGNIMVGKIGGTRPLRKQEEPRKPPTTKGKRRIVLPRSSKKRLKPWAHYGKHCLRKCAAPSSKKVSRNLHRKRRYHQKNSPPQKPPRKPNRQQRRSPSSPTGKDRFAKTSRLCSKSLRK